MAGGNITVSRCYNLVVMLCHKYFMQAFNESTLAVSLRACSKFRNGEEILLKEQKSQNSSNVRSFFR